MLVHIEIPKGYTGIKGNVGMGFPGGTNLPADAGDIRGGPPKTGGSWWKGLTECGPLEKGMANHFSILIWRTHEHYEKAER